VKLSKEIQSIDEHQKTSGHDAAFATTNYNVTADASQRCEYIEREEEKAGYKQNNCLKSNQCGKHVTEGCCEMPKRCTT
jgi:hypothetical protein